MVELTLLETSGTPDTQTLRRSPAAHLAELFARAAVRGARSVELKEIPFQAMVGIRVVPGSEGAQRLERELGTALPAAHGKVSSGSGGQVLWLSPDEFLLISGGNPLDLTLRLAAALGAGPGSVVDLSANRTTFELSGAAARDLLEKGCPLDLHPRVFQAGTAVNTNIGHVPVILWKTGEESYRIYPRASFADYLGRWIVDAMSEFSAPVIS